MTQNQFHELSERFAVYANEIVAFKAFIPSANKYANKQGALFGIGCDANANHIIIASNGSLSAIHFNHVQFPK